MRAINDGQKTLSAIKEEMVKVCWPWAVEDLRVL